MPIRLSPGSGETIAAKVLEPFVVTMYSSSGNAQLWTNLPCLVSTHAQVGGAGNRPVSVVVSQALCGTTSSGEGLINEWYAIDIDMTRLTETRFAIIPLVCGEKS